MPKRGWRTTRSDVLMRHRDKRLLWVAPVLVLSVVGCRHDSGRSTLPPVSAPDLIAVQRGFENDDAWRRHVGAMAGDRVRCAVQGLGSDPAVSTGRRVYAWALCQADNPHQSGTSGPVVVTLDRTGALVDHRTPGDGSGYAAGVRRLFPRALWGTILRHRVDVSRLQRELDLASASPTP